MAQSYQITEQGTDRETLTYGWLKYWLDTTSDSQNSIGWVVEDGRGVQDLCTVGEVMAIPGVREYVLRRTQAACERAEERGVPAAVVAALRAELAEA